MVAQPVVLWSAGPVECLAVHHPDADSIEVQIVESGRVITRRWFDRSEDAATFVTEQAVEFGASDIIGLIP